jgi:hypothetical protein
MDVPVLKPEKNDEVSYSESSSVFDKEIVSKFSKSIRTVSIFVARIPELLDAASGFDFTDFL